MTTRVDPLVDDFFLVNRELDSPFIEKILVIGGVDSPSIEKKVDQARVDPLDDDFRIVPRESTLSR